MVDVVRYVDLEVTEPDTRVDVAGHVVTVV